jgi:hypothetical protein
MPGDTLDATLSAEAPYDEMFGADGLCRPPESEHTAQQQQ